MTPFLCQAAVVGTDLLVGYVGSSGLVHTVVSGCEIVDHGLDLFLADLFSDGGMVTRDMDAPSEDEPREAVKGASGACVVPLTVVDTEYVVRRGLSEITPVRRATTALVTFLEAWSGVEVGWSVTAGGIVLAKSRVGSKANGRERGWRHGMGCR